MSGATVQASFAGWDMTEPGIGTAYLVMLVGVACAVHSLWLFRTSRSTIDSLVSSFALFALLEGLTGGFAAIAHHMLATTYWGHQAMTKSWGHANAEWMMPWAAAAAVGPLASASCLTNAIVFSGPGVECIRWVKLVGLLVSVVEVYFAVIDPDKMGTMSAYWAVATSAASCGVLLQRGPTAPGFFTCESGYFVRGIAYLVKIIVPAACHANSDLHVVHTDAGEYYRMYHSTGRCWYPKAFSQLAWFHTFIVVSVLLIYCGTLLKLDLLQLRPLFGHRMYLDAAERTWPTQPMTYKDNNRRCCGP